MAVEAVWNLADIFNGLMALPNVVALVTAIYSEHIFRQNKSRKLSNIRDLSMYIYSSFYFIIFLSAKIRQ